VSRLVSGVAVAAAVAVIVPIVALAAGSDPNGMATFMGTIKSSGKTATLNVRYRCASGDALWVSAKQRPLCRSVSQQQKQRSSA
jgi:hypothetical protein